MIYRGVPYIIGPNGERIYDCVQRSEQWDILRMGIATSSDFDKVMTPITCKPSAQAEKYAIRKVTEIFLGRPVKKEIYKSAIETGAIREDEAVRRFEFVHGVRIQRVGFISNADHTYGCSPDGLIGDDDDFEVKCPDEDTQMGYLLDTERLKKDYSFQAQSRMGIHGRKRCHLYSHHPDMPEVHIVVERDDEYIKKQLKELEKFREMMNSMVEKLIASGYLKV